MSSIVFNDTSHVSILGYNICVVVKPHIQLQYTIQIAFFKICHYAGNVLLHNTASKPTFL